MKILELHYPMIQFFKRPIHTRLEDRVYTDKIQVTHEIFQGKPRELVA